MKCFNCGEPTFKRGVVPIAVTVGVVEFAGDVPGGKCSSCGASTVNGEAGARFELQVTAELVPRGLRSGAASGSCARRWA